MLHIVHRAHQGLVARKMRSRECMFWCGMMKDVQDVVKKCTSCAMNKRKMNHQEQMLQSEIPVRPLSKIGADLF